MGTLSERQVQEMLDQCRNLETARREIATQHMSVPYETVHLIGDALGYIQRALEGALIRPITVEAEDGT